MCNSRARIVENRLVRSVQISKFACRPYDFIILYHIGDMYFNTFTTSGVIAKLLWRFEISGEGNIKIKPLNHWPICSISGAAWDQS